MNCFARVLLSLLSTIGIVCWTRVTVQVWQWGHAFTGFGVGDGAGGGGNSPGAALFGLFLIGVIWLLPVSPYLLMVAGSLGTMGGKALRIAYRYSLVVISILTVIDLLSLLPTLEVMAAVNILAGGLWIYASRRKHVSSHDSPHTEPTGPHV